MDVEGAVYSVYDNSEKRYNFYDNKGNLLENYKRHQIQYDEVDFETDDHDFYREIGEGFYKYTTHEVINDVDGEYGLFGIKHNDGRKLTDEIYYQVGEFSNGLCYFISFFIVVKYALHKIYHFNHFKCIVQWH